MNNWLQYSDALRTAMWVAQVRPPTLLGSAGGGEATGLPSCCRRCLPPPTSPTVRCPSPACRLGSRPTAATCATWTRPACGGRCSTTTSPPAATTSTTSAPCSPNATAAPPLHVRRCLCRAALTVRVGDPGRPIHNLPSSLLPSSNPPPAGATLVWKVRCWGCASGVGPSPLIRKRKKKKKLMPCARLPARRARAWQPGRRPGPHQTSNSNAGQRPAHHRPVRGPRQQVLPRQGPPALVQRGRDAQVPRRHRVQARLRLRPGRTQPLRRQG